jgi:hypothetical protein
MSIISDLDTKTFATKWNVKPRTVANYCANGFIPGAIKERGVWKIPSNSIKPLSPDNVLQILRLVNTLKHYPDIEIDYDVTGLAEKNISRVFNYLVNIRMLQPFDSTVPEDRMPYLVKLTQRGLEYIVTIEKKVMPHTEFIIKTGLSALVSAAVKLAIAA